MRILLLIFLLAGQAALGQQANNDPNLAANLEKTIRYLSDDKLEGRRTGTAGERLAYEYIRNSFREAGITPASNSNDFIQEFEIKDGRVLKHSKLEADGKDLKLHDEYFPLANSANADLKTAHANDVRFLDLAAIFEAEKNSPHFDIQQKIIDAATAATATHKLLVLYNSSDKKTALAFDPKSKLARLSLPVIYITEEGLKKIKLDKPGKIKVSIAIDDAVRKGHNVLGFIDNQAKTTIVLGAHYDHLGYGEDHNTLYAGKEKMVHNGADDNASGTAALIELARWIKTSGLKKHNYLFAAFSGEELGLYGSKYLVDHSPVDLASINYMINMDMIGRMNDSTRGLTIGGYGTSPEWAALVKKVNGLSIKFDSSGTGPSDHTSFYRKDIPVLFFFTGTHMDYHKPSDDADKINYDGSLAVIGYIKDILEKTNNLNKLAFSKTREQTMARTSFKVSLGIMPDYTYAGQGVLVEAVSEGRPAQKAGVKAGDVLLQLGEFKFTDVQSYMGALNKFNKGETTTVRVQRGTETLSFPITF